MRGFTYFDKDGRARSMTRREFDEGFEPPAVSERPRCAHCDEPRSPFIHEKWERVDRDRGFESVISSRRFTGHYRGYGVFCTLRCAHAFAEAAFVAGYRMARK